MLNKWTASAAALAAWSLAAPVRAGNDDGILLGNDAALTAGAVVATVSDGSALWYNPAGLARARNDSVDVGASAFALRKYNIPEFVTAGDGTKADASFTEIVSIPSAVTFVRRSNERVVLGLALFASQLSDYTLRSSLAVEDPSSRVRLGIQTVMTQEIARYHLAGGIGIRLAPKLTLGVALFGDYGSAAGSQRLSSDARVGGELFNFAVNSLHAEQTVWGFHLRAGLAYQVLPSLSLGLSVESPGMFIYRNERTTVIESETNLLAEGTGPGDEILTATPVDVSTSGGDFGLYAPVRVRLGAALQLRGATLALEGDVQSKLRTEVLEIDRELVWNLRLGGQLPISESVRLGLGLFTDRGADRKDAYGAGRLDFYGATFGGEYQKARWFATDQGDKRAGLTFSTTLALRYAYGTGKLPGVHIPVPFEQIGDPLTATDIDVHELTVHLGSGLYF